MQQCLDTSPGIHKEQPKLTLSSYPCYNESTMILFDVLLKRVPSPVLSQTKGGYLSMHHIEHTSNLNIQIKST